MSASFGRRLALGIATDFEKAVCAALDRLDPGHCRRAAMASGFRPRRQFPRFHVAAENAPEILGHELFAEPESTECPGCGELNVCVCFELDAEEAGGFAASVELGLVPGVDDDVGGDCE